jgi:F-type H+-transporting ATPase subunit a
MLNLFISSPLEQFEVTSLLGLHIPLLSFNFVLTSLGFYVILTVLISVLIHSLSYNNNLIPSRWGIAIESSYTTLHNILKEQTGSANERYLPFVYALFWFIMIGNLLGNVPYSFAFFSSAVAAISISLLIFFGVTTLSLSKHGLHFFSFFVPQGAPVALIPMLVLIELISYLARAISLGVRLMANIIAGHTLLVILSGMLWPIMTSGILLAVVSLLPTAIFIALVGLEIAVSLIQAYVFTLLVCSYLNDAINLH